MFFRKKKETKPMVKFTFSHPLLGNIQYWGDLGEWQTTLYKFRIFKKEYDVCIWISSDGSSPKFDEKQETAVKMIIHSIDELQKSAENELSSFFKVDNPVALTENIEIEDINITKNGDICLSILSSFDDSILEFIPEDALFTDSFGISVFPEVKTLPSVEDYFDFRYRE
ncbi:MAG: hypothetical protein HDT42_03105 [Ruminococcaceae bacterium]|nr:hypothetical protein [Oscillospiraceae bacterium]